MQECVCLCVCPGIDWPPVQGVSLVPYDDWDKLQQSLQPWLRIGGSEKELIEFNKKKVIFRLLLLTINIQFSCVYIVLFKTNFVMKQLYRIQFRAPSKQAKGNRSDKLKLEEETSEGTKTRKGEPILL